MNVGTYQIRQQVAYLCSFSLLVATEITSGTEFINLGDPCPKGSISRMTGSRFILLSVIYRCKSAATLENIKFCYTILFERGFLGILKLVPQNFGSGNIYLPPPPPGIGPDCHYIRCHLWLDDQRRIFRHEYR